MGRDFEDGSDGVGSFDADFVEEGGEQGFEVLAGAAGDGVCELDAEVVEGGGVGGVEGALFALGVEVGVAGFELASAGVEGL
ncbi:MAG: hypothetical protein M0013_02995 [Actinomycetota bacterium]|nr:hypothetical protein [Actinomycetota bacterium]